MAASSGSSSSCWDSPEVYKHHEQRKVCISRPKYREGRNDRAVKVRKCQQGKHRVSRSETPELHCGYVLCRLVKSRLNQRSINYIHMFKYLRCETSLWFMVTPPVCMSSFKIVCSRNTEKKQNTYTVLLIASVRQQRPISSLFTAQLKQHL